MAVIRNSFEINGEQALRTVQLVQKRFLSYNDTLGQVISQQASFTRGSKTGIQTLVQVNSEGRKTTTVVKSLGDQYQVLSTRVGQASAAQRKAAIELKEQAKLADSIARQLGGARQTGGSPITTGISANSSSRVDPTKKYANITTAQAQAAARDNNLTATQTAGFIRLVEQAGKVKSAIAEVSKTYNAFADKLNEAGKIAFATGIYRGISLISSALKDGIATAVSYANQIGLIQTISQGSGETFDTWNAAIRKTADSLGVPVARVAKDAYDALSNQVIQTTKDFGLLETAIHLEQITGSSAGTGLNVLSSIINGLGVNANQAGVLADKLFTIVDVGKVKLEGLDKIIGRTTSLQKAAGASFNETAAALAVLTQAGIDEQESTTLLNNIYSETIKPNKALAEQLNKMGFNTGEAAVQTLTLIGYLKELQKASSGTKDGLATFFPDIRGLRGVAVLLQQLDNLDKALIKVKNSQGEGDKALGIVNANPGQQLMQEQQRLKNFFTTDIGVESVKAAAKLTQALGGVENILKRIVPIITEVTIALSLAFVVSKIATFTTFIFSAAGAFGGLKTAIDLVTAAQLTCQSIAFKLTSTISGFLAVAVATYLGATYAVNRFKQAQVDAFNIKAKPIDLKFTQRIDTIKNESSTRVLAFESSVQKMTAKYGEFIAKARILNNSFAENAKKAFDKATNALENSFSISLNYVRKIVSSIENEENKISKNLEKLGKGNHDLIEDQEDRFYQRSLNDYQRYYQEKLDYTQRFNEAQKAAGNRNFEQFDSAGTKNAFTRLLKQRQEVLSTRIDDAFANHDLERADDLFKELIRTIDDYKSTLDSLGYHKVNINTDDQRATLAFLAKRKEYELEQQKDTARLEQNSIDARKTLKELEDVYKEIADFGNTAFDKKTGKLNDDYKNEPAKALADLTKLNEKALELQNTIKTLGGDTKAQNRARSIFSDIEGELTAQKKALALRLAASTNEDVLTKASETRKQLATEEIKIYSNLEAAQTKIGTQLAENTKQLLLQLTAVRQLNSKTLQDSNPIAGLFSAKTDSKTQKETDIALEKMMKLAEDPAKNRLELQRLFNQATPGLEKLKNNSMINPNNPEGEAQTVETSAHAIQNALNSISGQAGLLKDVTKDLRDLQTTVDMIDSKGLNDLDGTMRDIGTQAAGIENTSKATDALAISAANLAKALELEAKAQALLNAERAKIPTYKDAGATGNGGVVEGHAMGGVVGSQGGFLAAFMAGDYAKGTDTIPAMLTRDEFVVRAPMARKFFSQLVAINSNQTPIYRSEGGSSTSNNNTSNYHINVSGSDGGSSNDLAKKIVTAVRRAQVQGVIQ